MRHPPYTCRARLIRSCHLFNMLIGVPLPPPRLMPDCQKDRVMTMPEIDFRTMKLMVALIALSLSGATLFFAEGPLISISHAYCSGGTSRDIFVGFLFAIAAIMTAHNGANRREKIASKIAGVSAVGIALVPTACDTGAESPWHFAFAALMFAILAWFCWSFYQRTRIKPHQTQAQRRRVVYALCGIGILASMALIAVNGLFDLWPEANLSFYCEAAGLALFGVSWLIASHFLPYFEHPSERMKLTAPPVKRA